MFHLGKKQATSSLHALRRKITLQTLTRLQPILLLQMLVGISQSVNSSVSRSQTLARTLLLSGQQRLNDLLASAPRLHLSVEQILEFCRPSDAKHTPEEDAAHAERASARRLLDHVVRRLIGSPAAASSARSHVLVSRLRRSGGAAPPSGGISGCSSKGCHNTSAP